MSAIPATNPYSDLGLAASQAAAGNKKDLGQADFLRLMTEQLKNQDPLKPLDNKEFLGQLAQFSTVQGIQEMQNAMGQVATVMESDQALRAASLVGRDALVAADSVTVAAGTTVNGTVETKSNGPVTVEITDATGRVVRRIDVDAASAGSHTFAWDGKDNAGTVMPAGTYGIKATQGAGSSAQSLTPMVNAHVDSVSIGPQGLVLNLTGLGAWPLSAIRRIG